MSRPEFIQVDADKYIREDLAKEVVTFTGEESVASRAIGKFVIVRSRNEGINAGTVVLADTSGIELKDCRRLFYHKPKDTKVSWYEGVATSGIASSSKVSGTVPTKIIIEDYSVTLCTKGAEISIMGATPNAQN